jgi:hypothetical protein
LSSTCIDYSTGIATSLSDSRMIVKLINDTTVIEIENA